MKDIIISKAHFKRELRVFLVLFLLVNAMNIFSIFFYKTSISELYTSLGYVVFISLVLYLFVAVVRGLRFIFFRGRIL